MKNIAIITIHGINTLTPEYAEPFWKNLDRLGTPAAQFTTFWAAKVPDMLRRWAGLYTPPKAAWWDVIGRIMGPAVGFARSCQYWARVADEMADDSSIVDIVISRIHDAREAGNDRFVFVSHSLGTIIMAQAIRRALDEGAINEAEIRGIVTMGAALALWRTPEHLRPFLRSIPCLAWVNVLDPMDPIAGYMKPIDSRIIDIEIDLRGWMSSHCHYWESKDIARIVHGSMITPN